MSNVIVSNKFARTDVSSLPSHKFHLISTILGRHKFISACYVFFSWPTLSLRINDITECANVCGECARGVEFGWLDSGEDGEHNGVAVFRNMTYLQCRLTY